MVQKDKAGASPWYWDDETYKLENQEKFNLSENKDIFMLFACEYCYGFEMILAGLASSGLVVAVIHSWIHRFFRHNHVCKGECHCDHDKAKVIETT